MAKQDSISHDQILSDLQQKRYAPVYFLMGEEPYYIDVISDYIQKNVLDEAEKEFDYIENDKHDIGFIAQEYQTVLPAQVAEGADGMLSLNQNLVPYLVKAIQELKAEFEAYKSTHP